MISCFGLKMLHVTNLMKKLVHRKSWYMRESIEGGGSFRLHIDRHTYINTKTDRHSHTDIHIHKYTHTHKLTLM